MDRRRFLKVMGASTVLAAMPEITDAVPGGGNRKRPNMFMIFVDDITTRDIGCYGSPVVRTPNIDRLAREGIKFTHMFTPASLCAPSRAALFTGLYPFRNGAHPNHSEVKPGIKSVAHYLSALGYRVILLGKRHIEPQKESFPFEFYRDLPFGFCTPGNDLKKILADPGDKPFCLIFVKGGAHDMWPCRNPIYQPSEVDIPPYHVDTPETRKARARYYSNITATDTGVGEILRLLEKNHLEDNTLVMFTADQGTGWPHEKFNLYDGGISVPFIVRWPGKIRPGTETDALASYVDVVPTMIEIAGGDVSRIVSECGGEELDGKSLLAVVLGQKKEHSSKIYACLTWDVLWAYPMRAIRTRTHKYIWNIDSHFKFNSGWASGMLHHRQTGHWDIWQSWVKKAQTDAHAEARVRAELFRPPEELYDLRQDPYEMHNLVDDPNYQDIKNTLRLELKAWMQQQGDAGDSVYHKEAGSGRNFLDDIYCRQKVVNVEAQPVDWPFTHTVQVELSCFIWEAEIRYTLDGTEPTPTSKLYTGPFKIDPPLTLKAKAFWKGGQTPLKVWKFEGINFRFHYDGHYKATYR